MTGRPRLAIGTAVALALALPAVSQAGVTIGSDLTAAPTRDSGLGTWANGRLEVGLRAPGGLRSAVNGTVTRWRIRVGERSAPIRLRVIKPVGPGLFTGAGASTVQIPATNATSTFTTHLPISRGALIGTDTLSGIVTQFYADASPTDSRLLLWFQPSLADGDAGASPNVDAGSFVNLVNADVEPTSRFKINRVKALDGGRIWMGVTLPNRGKLRVGDSGERVVSSMMRIQAAGRRSLTIKPTPAALSELRGSDRIKAKLQISFTPIHGLTSSRVVRANLHR